MTLSDRQLNFLWHIKDGAIHNPLGWPMANIDSLWSALSSSWCCISLKANGLIDFVDEEEEDLWVRITPKGISAIETAAGGPL